ncbi:MAG: hypothetical protein HKO03_05265 [Acidimicrobiia bacterium]|nr:hypothetical protein [Acidimicrobiia bacterium]
MIYIAGLSGSAEAEPEAPGVWDASVNVNLDRTDGKGAGPTQITYTVNGGSPQTANGKSLSAKDLTGSSATFVVVNVSASVPYDPALNVQTSITVFSP